jgi:hypothetical protein
MSNPLESIPIGKSDDPDSWSQLVESVRAWEPKLELAFHRDLARLYDPDGTLYAVLLSARTTLATDRRSVPIETGDLVVVPQGLAIDAASPASFLCLTYFGAPPYHFRERFIQVWGFEHVKGDTACHTGILADALSSMRERHRCGFARLRVASCGCALPRRPFDIFFLIPTEGRTTLQLPGASQNPVLAPGDVAMIVAPTNVMLEGDCTVAMLGISTEIQCAAELQERKTRTTLPLSPEFGARAHDCEDKSKAIGNS